MFFKRTDETYSKDFVPGPFPFGVWRRGNCRRLVSPSHLFRSRGVACGTCRGRINAGDAGQPAGIDPSGENGEFHTCVDDGPMLTRPLDVEMGEVVARDGFVFAGFRLRGRKPALPVRASNGIVPEHTSNELDTESAISSRINQSGMSGMPRARRINGTVQAGGAAPQWSACAARTGASWILIAGAPPVQPSASEA